MMWDVPVVPSGCGVLARPAPRAARTRLRAMRYVIALRVDDPGLERRLRPGTGSPTQVDRRRKPPRHDSPIERCARRRCDPENVPDAVEGWNHAGVAVTSLANQSVQIHQRIRGDGLRRAPRHRVRSRSAGRRGAGRVSGSGVRRERLPGESRPAAAQRRASACSRTSHRSTSNRHQPTARPWNLSLLENRPIRCSPTRIQRGRRVSRATSWARRSSCRNGGRSLIHGDRGNEVWRVFRLESNSGAAGSVSKSRSSPNELRRGCSRAGRQKAAGRFVEKISERRGEGTSAAAGVEESGGIKSIRGCSRSQDGAQASSVAEH